MHEFFFENLRNPARIRCAGLMRQFRPGQVYSRSTNFSTAVLPDRQLHAVPVNRPHVSTAAGRGQVQKRVRTSTVLKQYLHKLIKLGIL